MKFFSPIEHICHMPITFQKKGTSPSKIISDSKINVDSLTTRSISDVLKLTPSLVESWLQWSEEKRVPHGWYFQRMEHGYVVGFNPRGERLVFEDGLVACADFILREVRSIN